MLLAGKRLHLASGETGRQRIDDDTERMMATNIADYPLVGGQDSYHLGIDNARNVASIVKGVLD